MRVSSLCLAFFLVGACAPSNSAWRAGMDGAIGREFGLYLDPHGYYGSLWSPVNKNRGFDKVTEEGGGRRYFITWIRSCQYSILVSSGGVVRSWRYEVKDIKDCYVF
ncbi:hypothetical protein E8E91_16985 [Pseudomonas sp. BN515]|nr:hypothetical protein [Pseudomonas sp. BN515]